jgi:hypothetical protein
VGWSVDSTNLKSASLAQNGSSTGPIPAHGWTSLASEKSCFEGGMVHGFYEQNQLNCLRMVPQQESHLPTAGLPTVLSFEENQMFKGRGIFKEEERFLKEI